MSSEAKGRVREGFSMVEMLVVVTIIGILAGLLMTAVQKVRDTARRTRARHDVNQIVTAWTAYKLEYRRLPAGITSMDSTAIQILRGSPRHADNLRACLFMDFATNTTSFLDPWNGVYQVALDDDGDNEVTAVGTNMPLTVAAWSMGNDGQSATADDVVSWSK